MASVENRGLLSILDRSLSQEARNVSLPPPLIHHIELSAICSQAEKECRPASGLTHNYDANADLEHTGPRAGRAVIGDRLTLEVLISPVQGRAVFTGLTADQQGRLGELLSQENLPVALRDLIKVTPTPNNTSCVDVDLLSVGVSKLALTDGLCRMICKELNFGNIPDFQYSPLSKGDPRLDQVAGSFGSLRPNLNFLTRRIGDVEVPVFTHAAEALIKKAQDVGGIIASIFEYPGRGKTFVIQHIIKMLASDDDTSVRIFGLPKSYVGQRMINVGAVGVDSPLTDSLVLVSPRIDEEHPFNLKQIITDFQELCARRPISQTVLIIDNAQDLQFPSDGEWLNQLEGFLKQLSQRRDGSGVVILGEHVPSGVNLSQFQGYRLGRVELPFTSIDLGLPKGKRREVNTSAVGYRLVTSGIVVDHEGKTFYSVMDRLYPQRDPPETFGDKYRESRDTIAAQMTCELLQHQVISSLFKNPKIAAYLSYAHLNTAAGKLQSALSLALENSTSQSWVRVEKTGKIIIKNTGKLQSIIDATARGLADTVNALADNKITEAKGRNTSADSLPALLSRRQVLMTELEEVEKKIKAA